MNKRLTAMLMTTVLMGSLLAACSGTKETGGTEATTSPTAAPSQAASPSTVPSPTVAASPSPEATSTVTAAPSAAPSASSEPSKEPAATKKPVASKAPTASKPPAATKKPVVTKTPAPTKKPVPSQTPAPSKKPDTMPSVNAMFDEIVKNVQQPNLMQLESGKLEEVYGINPSLAEEFTVRMPFVNIKTNEIAIFKVKNEKDIPTVKAGMEKRAKDVQKQFEHYLPDQYENAKNFKIVTHGNYVLFVISESSDELIKAFDGFFQK